MTDDDWDTDYVKSLGVFLNGAGMRQRDRRGQPVTDVNFIMYFNASEEGVEFTLPTDEYGAGWEVVVDTNADAVLGGEVKAGEKFIIGGRSVIIVRAQQ